MAKTIFKKQVLRVQTLGLVAYCETEFGQFRSECEKSSSYVYNDVYGKWAKKDNKWGFSTLSTNDGNTTSMVVKLPDLSDGESVVNLCASLALIAVNNACSGHVDTGMVGRAAGVIYNNLILNIETVETEERKEGEV